MSYVVDEDDGVKRVRLRMLASALRPVRRPSFKHMFIGLISKER